MCRLRRARLGLRCAAAFPSARGARGSLEPCALLERGARSLELGLRAGTARGPLRSGICADGGSRSLELGICGARTTRRSFKSGALLERGARPLKLRLCMLLLQGWVSLRRCRVGLWLGDPAGPTAIIDGGGGLHRLRRVDLFDWCVGAADDAFIVARAVVFPAVIAWAGKAGGGGRWCGLGDESVLPARWW